MKSYEKEYRHCLENSNKMELVDKIIYDEKEIERLKKCYCNRSDCAGRLNQKNEVYDSVVQRNEKAIEHINKELCNINVQENIMVKNELLKIKSIIQGVIKGE